MTEPPRTAANWALAALIAGSLCIALSPIFLRYALAEVGPVAAGAWRTGLAVPLFLPFIWKRGQTTPALSSADRRIILAGLFFAGDLASWHAGLMYTTIANSTLFANLAPIWVTAASFFLFGIRPAPLFLGGLVLAILGSALLSSVSLESAQLGDALSVLTGLFYAGYILAVGKSRETAGTARVMLVASAVSASVLLPFAIALGETLMPSTAQGWLAIAGLAVISHTLGQGLIAWALAHLPAALSAVSLLIQPVAAALLAWPLFGEALGPIQFAGGALILTGIWVARRATRS